LTRAQPVVIEKGLIYYRDQSVAFRTAKSSEKIVVFVCATLRQEFADAWHFFQQWSECELPHFPKKAGCNVAENSTKESTAEANAVFPEGL